MKKTDKPSINVTVNINVFSNLFSKNKVSTDGGISPVIAAFLVIVATLVVSHFYP